MILKEYISQKKKEEEYGVDECSVDAVWMHESEN